MESNAGIKVDISHSGIVPAFEAMQGDGGFRNISVELTERGKPWYPPSGVEVAVAYTHSNGTKGLYNKLPDGRKAVTVRGNTITAVLIPQMLAAAGEVQAAIVFNNKELDQLTTFPIAITVKKNPFSDAPETADYIRLQWLENKLDEYLMIAKESGMFDGMKGDPFTYEDFTPEQLAALTGPQGPAGDNTAALEAAQAANEIAAEAMQATSSMQQVVQSIAPAINQLRTDVANKLPKSPANWEAWTAEEQAAARERMGFDRPFELIEEIQLTEDTLKIVRTMEPDGTPYHFRKAVVIITAPKTEYGRRDLYTRFYCGSLSGACYSGISQNLDYYKRALSRAQIENSELRIGATDSTFVYGAQNTSSGDAVTYKERATCLVVTGNISQIENYCSGNDYIPAGFLIQIYGVRA